MSKNTLPKFTIKQLLEAGVHFGHKSMRRNPKMAKYVHSNRNGISIIDLNKTASLLYRVLVTVNDVAKNNGRILFVATKKQASAVVAEAAKRCGQYYVNYRWLGGMLTNWKTVSQSIKTLKKIEEQLADSEVTYSKKEKLILEIRRLKLEQALGGIKNMGGYPDLVFIIDTLKEDLAVYEAKKLNIPIIAVVDTNSNPDGITFPIPGNDDSAKAIKLYCNLISDAIVAGLRENMAAAGVDLSKVEEGTLPAVAPKAQLDTGSRKPKADHDHKHKKEFVAKENASEHKKHAPKADHAAKEHAPKAEAKAEKAVEEKSSEAKAEKPAAKKPAAKKPAKK